TVEQWPEREEVLRAAAKHHETMARLAAEADGGWKDPRFALTLEAWLPHLAVPPKVVVCLRSPEAFVRSVTSIFGLYSQESLERWWANHLRRTLDVVRDYRLEATSVAYEELVAQPEATVARLSSFVGRPLDARFIEPDLRQFAQPVPERHAALYEEVRGLRDAKGVSPAKE
ncbi:MAG: sulfotransferase, partial [Dehalococcoidia bacterium]|nr:sulfotransferase [Dehalococcoidia bacterium]